MSKQINITKTNKTSRDGRTVTRVYEIFVDGEKTDQRTSKTTDYTHFVVNAKTGKHRSAHTRQELAQKGLGEYGGPKDYTVVAVGITPERKAELAEQAVREVATAMVELDLHEQWRSADRMARLHNRHARQGDASARQLAKEARELAARLAAQIVEAGGAHPRTLRWK